VRAEITLELPDNLDPRYCEYVFNYLRKKFPGVEVRAIQANIGARIDAYGRYENGDEIMREILRMSLTHADESWHRENQPLDEPPPAGPVVSALQTAMVRVDRATFPHGPAGHVAIAPTDESIAELVANLVCGCASLDEAKAVVNGMRGAMVIQDRDDVIVYFPCTTWVKT
jgi:Arc/MetJ-type ribon-helix-helix transcriptional regulator